MTKTALATAAASKQGFSNAEFIAKAMEYAGQRYEMIWDHHLWRYSVTDVTQAVPADPAGGIVEINDATMAFVLAVRFADQELLPIDRETILRIAAEAYDGSGSPGGFDHLAPSVDGKPQIRLYRIPDKGENLLTIGKKKTPAWADDAEPMPLPGIANTLLALVAADLLEYQRQYGKAQAKFSEGFALLEKMVQTETEQRGRSRVVIPEPYDGGYSYDAHLVK